MLPWLQVLALVPLALVARLRAVERRMLARCRDAGADTAERAILLDQHRLVNRLVFRRLHNAGVLQGAGNDRYYWHAPAYAGFRRRRRRRAFGVILVLLAVMLVLFYRGDMSL
jgi:hypothetical protein